MAILLPDNLPAVRILEREQICVATKPFASQAVQTLKILVLNLMPKKIETETQLARMLGSTPLQVEMVLLRTKSHESAHVSKEHLLAFYKTFDEVQGESFDGLIITGAPVEHLPFEEVDYWQELCTIMEWSKTHVRSTFHVCWGAQAGLYYHYGIDKKPMSEKTFGVFLHEVERPSLLFDGFDTPFPVPQSRHTTIERADIEKVPELTILSSSEKCGVYAVADRNGKQVFITGHSEYDANTLKDEYLRDLSQGKPIHLPEHYFPDDDPSKEPILSWRTHAHLLYYNWLRYFVCEQK